MKLPPVRPGSSVSYILDGHQRLSTLYGCLRRPANARRSTEQRDWMWWVYRTLDSSGRGTAGSSRYRHWNSDGAPPAEHLPVRSILRTMDYLAYERNLSKHVHGSTLDRMLHEAEQLAQRIKSYKLAVVRLSGGSLNQAVEVFSRLNSGRQSTDRLASALTHATVASESLADRVTEIQERTVVSGFGDIPALTIFQAILAVSGEEDIQGVRREALTERAEGRIRNSVENADVALEKAVDFLRQRIGVPHVRLVPYNLQIVLLTLFFHVDRRLDEGKLSVLLRWFWNTSLAGYFAGADPSLVQDSLREMKDFAAGRGYLRS
ncbi:hypothetical protein Acor_30630 [Acrocarpospora corrugata]|uniref:DUF262 domain-containing protein n=1 Tax=Acrocarpospora corrugata TaxID=35763 RepID=A0A5M3VY29_9ACTN|nr:hypothetical protein Acor_30630 [Acrocarpospora corrugata]